MNEAKSSGSRALLGLGAGASVGAAIIGIGLLRALFCHRRQRPGGGDAQGPLLPPIHAASTAANYFFWAGAAAGAGAATPLNMSTT